MPIATYAELQSAVANWLDRADLADRSPEFIVLAESRLNRQLRLRLAEREANLAVGAGAASVALPADYGEALSLRAADPARVLRFRDPVLIGRDGAPGLPEFWTVDGATVRFERPCGQAAVFVLRYLARLALSDAAPANALLTAHPDLYLFAALVEAGPYLRDAELLSVFEARLQQALAEVNAKEGRSRALATLASEPAGVLPGAAFSIVQG